MASLTSLNITQLIVNVESASAPSLLQRTGAIVSNGSTNISPGTKKLLTQASDVTPYLAGTLAITSLTWASGVVTMTLALPFTMVVGDEFAIAGAVPVAYNGTYLVASVVTSGTVYTFALAASPGTNTTPGGLTAGNVTELVSQVGTYFAYPSAVPVYVLELGELTVPLAIAALETYININLQTIYAFLLPREWTTSANAATLEAFCLLYNAPNAMVYFFGTVTAGEASVFPATLKCLRLMIESPVIAATEFSMASPFAEELMQNPSATNQRTPASYQYMYGVTAYPQQNNQATLLGFLNAGLNYIGDGSEANITNTILRNGTGMDGNGFNVWYTIDWVQIQEGIANTQAVINGSNNPENPLDYDQAGINTLLAVLVQTISNAVTFGMINPNAPISVSATSFTDYVRENPDDYPAGIYRGLSASFTPQGGFIQVTINLTVFLTA